MESEIVVSAIVSTFNAEKFFRTRIENLLAQTIADSLEIIVVDSGSEQSESQILQPFIDAGHRIKYLRTERETLYAAWNRAIAIASGKFLSNANCDDRLISSAYETMIAALESNHEAPLAYSDAWETTDESEVVGCAQLEYKQGRRRVFQPDFSHSKLLLHCYVGAFPMWRRDAHNRYGVFDPNFVVSGDWEFWLRMAESSKFVHIAEPLGLMLRRDDSIVWGNQEKMLEENHRLRLKYFAQQQR